MTIDLTGLVVDDVEILLQGDGITTEAQQQLQLSLEDIEELNAKLGEIAEKESPFEHIYLGNFSATPITHSVYLHCERCNVSWTGCWDNMECEYCGRDCLHGSDHPDNPEGKTSRRNTL